MKKPNAILCSDFHLREDKPVCRTDNFWEAQWMKVQFISELQKKHDCIVIHSGDLFHHWKPSPYLLSTTIEHLPKKFFTVYGNHDLPQHSLELADKCGINVLAKTNRLIVLRWCHWGQMPENVWDESMEYFPDNKGSFFLNSKILVWHVLTWKSELPFPGCEGMSAKQILKKYPQYNLIVTGDNHQTFAEYYVRKESQRLLVNPGSLTRQTAKQIDHRPCVFLWYAETNTVEQVFLPIETNVVSREHIEIIENRNKRIDSFVSSLDTNWDINISLKSNFNIFFEKNKINEQTKTIIKKYVQL